MAILKQIPLSQSGVFDFERCAREAGEKRGREIMMLVTYLVCLRKGVCITVCASRNQGFLVLNVVWPEEKVLT